MQDLGSGPSIPRNSGLFGLMAGVRGGMTLFEPRGLPNDAPDTVAWALRDGPGAEEDFAHSWLTTDEVCEVWKAYDSLPDVASRPRVPAGFAATVGAMEAIDRWCVENEGGKAVLVISFG